MADKYNEPEEGWRTGVANGFAVIDYLHSQAVFSKLSDSSICFLPFMCLMAHDWESISTMDRCEYVEYVKLLLFSGSAGETPWG